MVAATAVKKPKEVKTPHGLIIRLPIALRNRFKSLCYARGSSMQTVLAEIVADYVSRAEKAKK